MDPASCQREAGYALKVDRAPAKEVRIASGIGWARIDGFATAGQLRDAPQASYPGQLMRSLSFTTRPNQDREFLGPIAPAQTEDSTC